MKPKSSKYQNIVTKETAPYVSNEPLHRNDIYLYRKKTSSDLREVPALFRDRNVYQPHKTFDFTETAQHFRFVWCQEFPWLCYYHWEDGVYCLYCVLFGHKSTSKSKIVNFYSHPYKKWLAAVLVLSNHMQA